MSNYVGLNSRQMTNKQLKQLYTTFALLHKLDAQSVILEVGQSDINSRIKGSVERQTELESWESSLCVRFTD